MTAPAPVDVLEVLDMAASRERAAGMPDGVQIAAHAAVAELIEERRVLIDALKEAHYRGLMIGADCAWALAKLQREGTYKPVCSDGRPSRADAGRDLEQIRECREKTKAALTRCGGQP